MPSVQRPCQPSHVVPLAESRAKIKNIFGSLKELTRGPRNLATARVFLEILVTARTSVLSFLFFFWDFMVSFDKWCRPDKTILKDRVCLDGLARNCSVTVSSMVTVRIVMHMVAVIIVMHMEASVLSAAPHPSH